MHDYFTVQHESYFFFYAANRQSLTHVIKMRKPISQIVTADGTSFITIVDTAPTLDTDPMRATCGNIAVHGAGPDIWPLVTDWALLRSVQIPETEPFLSILFTKLWCDKGTWILSSTAFRATSNARYECSPLNHTVIMHATVIRATSFKNSRSTTGVTPPNHFTMIIIMGAQNNIHTILLHKLNEIHIRHDNP